MGNYTIYEVKRAMIGKYGKADSEALALLKAQVYEGTVDRNALVKVGYGKLNVDYYNELTVTTWP